MEETLPEVLPEVEALKESLLTLSFSRNSDLCIFYSSPEDVFIHMLKLDSKSEDKLKQIYGECELV